MVNLILIDTECQNRQLVLLYYMLTIILNADNDMANEYLNLQEVEQEIAQTRKKYLKGEMTEGLRIMYLAQIRIDIQTLWKKKEIPDEKAVEMWERAKAAIE
jgi:hypothetical protein